MNNISCRIKKPVKENAGQVLQLAQTWDVGSYIANHHLSHHQQPANHSAAHHPEGAKQGIHAAQTHGHTSAIQNTALHIRYALANVYPGHSTAVFTRSQRVVRHPDKQGSPEYAEIPEDAVLTDKQLPVMYSTPFPRQDGDYEKPVPMTDAPVSDPNVGKSPPNIKTDDYEELFTAYTKLKRPSLNSAN